MLLRPELVFAVAEIVSGGPETGLGESTWACSRQTVEVKLRQQGPTLIRRYVNFAASQNLPDTGWSQPATSLTIEVTP
jgi:hypothetical protein